MKNKLVILLILPLYLLAQTKQNFKVVIVAFYNCENFYDTVHNPMIKDLEFTPTGDRKYKSAIYMDKVNKLATVISQIGTDISKDGPAIIGLAEVENDTVLNDLIHNKNLLNRHYKIVHYDSKDERGMDVALLYNPKYLIVKESMPLTVHLPSWGKYIRHTRDVLWVKGILDGEEVNILVNHWPSRLGDEEISNSGRYAAAAVCKVQMAELSNKNPNAKIILMGDLNDNPNSESVIKVLKAKGEIENVREGELFNPFVELYNKGIGTLAYQDSWGLFDQIMVNYPWLNKHQIGYFYFKQHVFNKEFLIENLGKYQGYPMRTWDGLSYRGGYSDHFPSYIILLKKTK